MSSLVKPVMLNQENLVHSLSIDRGSRENNKRILPVNFFKNLFKNSVKHKKRNVPLPKPKLQDPLSGKGLKTSWTTPLDFKPMFVYVLYIQGE